MTQPFNKSTRAPFEAGEVPAAGWFAIEPVCAWQPREQEELRRALGLPEEGPPVEARLDAAALAELADDFARRGDPAGLPVSKNHDFEAAAGWIKALQVEADRLWAWIEWTPEGHRAINNREYVYFSTEYDYGDFELVDGVAVPRRLAGLSVTNYPNHAEGQIPMTNHWCPVKLLSKSPLKVVLLRAS